jgi:glutathionylspermidine synthase
VRRLKLTPRSDWQAKAEAVGFVYHHTEGQAYWDESIAYAFTLDQVEQDLEPAAAELHDLCLDLVDEVAGSQELMERLAIPAEHRDFVAASWRAKSPSLYGRFDFGYDGKSKPKLYEYNADTPTSVFEAATFQWLWLEELIANGTFPANADQFNSLFEALRDRFKVLFPTGGFVHFASDEDAVEDRQTVRFLEDLALQAGVEPKFVAMDNIGLNKEGQFVDLEGFVLQAAFKLYPWEFMLREPYAAHLNTAQVRWIEPPWKAILSNKGILPLLWERHRGHPNLLEAYFEGDPATSAPWAGGSCASRCSRAKGPMSRWSAAVQNTLASRFLTRAMARKARSSRPITRRRRSTASVPWSGRGWSATSRPASAFARTTAW